MAFYRRLDASLVCPWGSPGMGVLWRRATKALRVSFMEKVRSYIGHAESCQTLARTALNNELKLEYVKLAGSWMDLAEERRLFVIETKRMRPH
jgi:hypothetical protein